MQTVINYEPSGCKITSFYSILVLFWGFLGYIITGIELFLNISQITAGLSQAYKPSADVCAQLVCEIQHPQ